MDLDSYSIDNVKNHDDYRKMYGDNSFISGKEDASNNWSRGHYTVGKEIIE